MNLPPRHSFQSNQPAPGVQRPRARRPAAPLILAGAVFLAGARDRVTAAAPPPPAGYQLIPLTLTNSAGDVAFKINARGVIAGTIDGPDGVSRGYRYAGGQEQERGGWPGSKFTEWSGFTATGDLVGYYADPADPKSGTYKAYLRRADGTTSSIGWSGDTNFNFTVAINASGQIAGGSSLQGWVRNPDDTYVVFDTPGYQTSGAWGLNDAGVAVGVAFNGFFDTANGLIYDSKSNTFQIWNYPGAIETTLYDINNHGDIVGGFKRSVTSPEAPFVRWSDGTLLDLHFPEAANVRVTGINDQRLIVGRYDLSDDTTRSFVATPLSGLGTTTIRRYVATRVDVPQAAHAVANAINDAGTIVGEWFNADYSVNEGFLRHAAGEVTSIQPADTYGGITVFAVNNRGDIAGFMESDAYVRRGTNFTLLIPPGAGESYARGVNDAGIVVGDATGLSGNFHFLHDGTNFVSIDLPGTAQSGFVDINNAGEILGYSISEVAVNGATQSIRADWILRGTNRQDLAFPDASLHSLSGIANNGTVLGFFRHASSGRRDRFYLYETGTYTEVEIRGELGGNRFSASDVNQDGVIVGTFRTPDGAYHGFRAVPDNTQDRLLVPVGLSGEVRQIGPHGSEGVFAQTGLLEPTAMVSGPDGLVYIADAKRNAVLRFSAAGRMLGVVADQDLSGPTGLAFDTTGNLYIANRSANNVVKIAPDGTRSVFIAQGLDGPVSVVRDPQGNFLVSNATGNNIRRFSGTGADLGLLITNLHRPAGLAFDTANILHVAETGANQITRFDTNGVPFGVFAADNLQEPTGLAFARNGDLYVANAVSGTVRRFAATGFDLGLVASGWNQPGLLAIVPTLPILDRGHGDAGIDFAEGQWNVHLHDEENDIEYRPEAAVVQVSAAARTTIPADTRFDFLGKAGDPVWVIPQVANESVIYLGLAADGVNAGVMKDDTVRFTLVGVDGPGHFVLYAIRGFGNPVVYMNSRDGVSAADFRDLPVGGHEHLNWVFDAPGYYEIRLQASGTLASTGEPVVSPVATYRFQILAGTPPEPEPEPAPGFTFERIAIAGAAETTIADIQNDGTLVGRIRDDAGLSHGFVRKDTNLVTFNITGNTATFAGGLNAAGTTAGFYRNATNAEIQHGFLRSADGTVTTIDGDVPGFTYLWRINDAGQANGYWFEDDPFFIRSFRRDTNGALNVLVYPGSPMGTVARGMNDAGILTGWKWDEAFALQGVVIEGTNFTQVFSVEGWDNTLPGDINNHGDIAGTVNIAFEKTAGFFRRSDGATRTFQPPGATSVEVFGINDEQEIVGEYTIAGGQRFGFVARPATQLTEHHADVGIGLEDGALDLHVHDDEADREFEPSGAVLRVGEAAEVPIPDTLDFQILGAPGRSAWILPATEKEGVLFLGLGTEEIPAGVLIGDRISLQLVSVIGNGDAAAYSVDGLGAVTVHWNSGDGLSEVDQITLVAGSHRHVNWAFNAPGTYELRFRASAVLVEGQRPISAEAAYTFVVPDAQLPQPQPVVRPAYTWKAIRVPGATNTFAFGIDDQLRIVGRSGDEIGGKGYLLDPEGHLESIEFPTAHFTEAFDLDASGQIAGWFTDATRTSGFLRDTNGIFQRIDLPNTSSTIVLALNDQGWTAGFFTNAIGERGFLRSPTGDLTFFDPPGSLNTQPYGLNNHGVVAGYFATDSGEHGFVRGTNGLIEVFDPPGSLGSGALGINDHGALSGYYADATGLHGYVRTPENELHTLDYPGAHATVALGINNQGDVVGYSEDATGHRTGFLARPATRLEQGHTDVGVTFEEGRLEWEIHSDALERHFSPAAAVLDVPARALTRVPDAPAYRFLGEPGSPSWILPQTSSPSLLFLGLAAEEVSIGSFRDDRLSVALESVQGPGNFSVFTVGGFGTPELLFDSSDGIGTNDVVRLNAGSHNHVNWGFTAPGTYHVVLAASGVLVASGETLTVRETFTFEVTSASPTLSAVRGSSGSVALSFATEDGVVYQIESAPGIAGPWTSFGAPIIGTGRRKEIAVPTNAASAVFRVRTGVITESGGRP
ncbi:MAG: choice-of-anchor M domain-containing protein [Verrucomicrobiales bacterium]|nr:choice-of-anchor M domain-containing protein [Verrucomicrobiales bacterium]